MRIPTELQMLMDSVFNGNHSDAEWLELESRVRQYLDVLPECFQDVFVESGAGEMLYMICSGIRKMGGTSL